MEPIITCPFHPEAEEAPCTVIKNNKLYQCAWYTKLTGVDPTTGKEVDSKGCAIAFLPILSVEISQTNRGQTGAIGNLEKAVTKGQDEFTNLVLSATNNRMLE